jgi:twitching motility protein PilT
MTEKQGAVLLGRLAVHNKMITPEQLSEATEEQGRRAGDSPLGQILVEKGFITSEQVAKLVRAQKEMIARKRASQAAERAAPQLEETPQAVPASRESAPVSGPTKTQAPPSPEPAPASPPVPDAPAVEQTPAPAAPAVEQTPAPAAPVQAASTPAAPKTGQPVLAKTGAVVVPSPEDNAAFNSLLSDAVSKGASDIHIHAGAPTLRRIAGELETSSDGPLDPDRAELLVMSALTPEQRNQFAEHGEIDFCYTLDGVGRFRANAYRQQRGVDGVFRHIPQKAPSLEELGLPTSLAKFINYHQGMVLVTGPTGCGKSSTLAALVNLINEERKEHILTIEDPIEYLHPSKRCIVNQRSVHSHTETFARALRAALREDPDVIVIGELRDLETISLALSAAETGHLVLATLHTNNAIRTLNRLIGAFPADQQGQIRMMISESLRAVISQRLIRRADGKGRVAAVERLVNTRAVGNLIRENKTFQLHSILQTGSSQGMGLLDHSIKEHLDAGTISREDALKNCDDAKLLGPEK